MPASPAGGFDCGVEGEDVRLKGDPSMALMILETWLLEDLIASMASLICCMSPALFSATDRV